MAEIIFSPPGKSEPGFLRRMKKSLQLRKELLNNPQPEHVDGIIEFLLPFVAEPKDKKKAEELLLDASQEDFENMLASIAGKKDESDEKKVS